VIVKHVHVDITIFTPLQVRMLISYIYAFVTDFSVHVRQIHNNKILFFRSPEPKAEVSYCRRNLSVRLFGGPSVNFYSLNDFSRTNWPISTKLGGKHDWEIQIRGWPLLGTNKRQNQETFVTSKIF